MLTTLLAAARGFRQLETTVARETGSLLFPTRTYRRPESFAATHTHARTRRIALINVLMGSSRGCLALCRTFPIIMMGFLMEDLFTYHRAD